MLNVFRKILYKLPGVAFAYHHALAFFGALVCGFPSRKIFVIGVTGTKGKTTTLELLNSFLEASGKRTALLSSLRIKTLDKTEKNLTSNSMPGRFFIQKFLGDAARGGCEYALIEVTSQGVAASRHKFINWQAGIITNIAPEHIEAHGSFENYRATKLKFLRDVAAHGGFVYINADDEKSVFFSEQLRNTGKIIPYSKNNLATNNIIAQNNNLIGDFEQENVAAAAAFAFAIGIKPAFINEAIKNFRGVSGRMEFVQREPFVMVVDYAHTPDSLRAVYSTLRKNSKFSFDGLRIPSGIEGHIPNSKMICVLGSAGGGRDKWKRPEMGKIAAEYCDEIILTNEDPYDEIPDRILSEIKSGVTSEKRHETWEIVDRKEALQKAVSLAKPGDIVVATGKGSEPYMYFEKGRKIPWDEKGIVEKILKIK